MPNEPVSYKGVMVSSTFTDLVEHRAALIRAIARHGLMALGMENDSAKPAVDVIDSSLQMVRDASAYVGVISHKYGQIPEDPKRNPDRLSLTELEFNEALRLGRPVLLFIMGAQHKVTIADIESDPDKKAKLLAFTKRAKRMSSVERVYKEFNDLQEFALAATQSIAELRRLLDRTAEPATPISSATVEGERDFIPAPPELYAEPPYIGSHKFVGRESQLETLSDWAVAADPHPVLLFEAIGGAGKSMLTWEWTTRHATTARQDWAGRFWYSFYEKGAVMADFCQRALAYMTGRPLKAFRKKKTAELSELLLQQLRACPWLLILDGLERVLVAYHRIDAAQVADEDAGGPDQIARRDPCTAIRPEDDDLLRALASSAPSKLLLTSRLIPRVLLNPASQPIPGVLHERLPGLRPADAEALLRSCGVTGDSQEIQTFLKSHCDCHPLVTGVLAGLIQEYLPDRGNFDAWASATDGGAALNLANLDLVQKRNHILQAALDALPEKSRQLLSTLALLSEAVDWATLSALNPHLPPEPEEVKEPVHPEHFSWWEHVSEDERSNRLRAYQVALQRRKEYERAVEERRQSPALLSAPQELVRTVRDLERRGLLQYDHGARRYDLHPVVRGIAAGRLRDEEKETYGQRVIDYFSRQSHNPYEEAETLEDIRNGLHLVRTLIRMGRRQEALDAYSGALANALIFNLEAHATQIALLRPFFPHGWGTLPDDVVSGAYVANDAGIALQATGELQESLGAYQVALYADLRGKNGSNLRVAVTNISLVLLGQNRIAAAHRCTLLGLEVAGLAAEQEELFRTRLYVFAWLVLVGRRFEAEEMWNALDPMGRNWTRRVYLPGEAEHDFARFRFTQGDLSEEQLTQAEALANAGRSRGVIRSLHGLRGEWQLAQRNWALAASSLHEAVRMAREVGQSDPAAEAQLALANFHLGRLAEPRQEAERLSTARQRSDIDLAALWLAIGDREQAKQHALAAYKWAWADGEPYVRRYELNRARALLEQLGVPIPELPPYDPDKDEKFPWEQDVAEAIAKWRAEKEQKEAKTDE